MPDHRDVSLAVALDERRFRGGHVSFVHQWVLGLTRLGWRVSVFDPGAGATFARPETGRCIDVMGYASAADRVQTGHDCVFLDIDPGFGQMWHELGLADV